ncbi:MAG: serine protease, partial [Planctomycetota bacterium]
MRRSHRLAFPLFFLCPAAAALASDVELIKENGQWIQRDSMGGNYVVNPDVISLRWRAPIETQDQLITHLNTEQNPLVESVSLLNTLRTNRLGISDLQLAEGQDPVEMVAALEATGLFEFVTVNTFGEWIGVPNDAQYPNQYALNNTGQTGGSSGADIGAEDMWDIETGDPSVRIAVLDSGTDIFHPDLAPNRWEKLADPINGVDDDANGFIDDFYGWDFGDGDNDVVSSSFHGTFVAGIVAARTDNGIGISGVAGGFGANDGCTIMPVPVGSSFPDGSILDDAILYAADEGARIITLSLSVGPSAAIDAAVTSATIGSGVWINNASGNSGGSNNVGYPAYLPEITAVGSTNDNGAVSGFSSGGPQVFICAPGEEVLSTNLGNGYGISSGTSFASPHIAGIVGLM